jgi:hypothetical protein
MEFVRSEWTIVVAGAWNVGIFQPPWVSSQVFEGQELRMEMQIGAVGPALRYHIGLATLIVRPESLVGAVREETPQAINEVTNMIGKILELLPHTPVTACGINFGFREQNPDESLRANFAIADNPRIVDLGGVIRQTTVERTITIDGGLLRLRETFEEAGSVHFHLNFHYDVENGTAAAQIIRNNAAQKRTRALELMNAVYGLRMEKNNGE